MPNYAPKSELEKAIGVDTSNFAQKVDVITLKSNVDISDIDQLERVPNDLSSLKSR